MHGKFIAAALLSFVMASSAHATPSNPALQVASAVGHWIAEQGNAALREIREELRRELEQQIQPLLPTPAQPADDGAQQGDPAGS